MRDSRYDDTAVRLALPAAVRSANGVVNGAAVDMAGARNNFRTALLVALAGAVTDGTHTVGLEHSDSDSGGWAAVPADQRQGVPPVFTSAQANSVARMGYTGAKRYLRATLTTSGAPATPSGGTIAVLLLLGSGSGRPVT